MKISKLFHWLYAILMLLPFGLVIFNMLHGLFSPSATTLLDFTTYWNFIDSFEFGWTGGVADNIYQVYFYLLNDVFMVTGGVADTIENLLTYWTCISIIWLVFDVFMYVPLLVHRWIDKAKLE